ncbi:phosphatase PAP2 family protein [Sansalvadorimonas verongulae]|uniref:phosphatase PAP2 family protein n=1 Tax=Sansalvadorimonas verongulae TaxID=2172824 RepID=UPI0012BBA42A|nr:phosphatase PAP2 family protein [Sansalvadorimonas verongulae]MTI15149.1 phosphatase PAP2 family protein [Sansalvadorimonas verongulae]
MSAIVNSLLNVDVQLLHILNTVRLPALDGALHFFTNTAYLSSALCMAIIGLRALVKRSRALQYKAALLFVGVGASAVIALLVKHGLHRARPFVTYPDLITQLADASRLSFPSGHTTVAFATAFMVATLYRTKPLTAVVFIWALVVGYSRMALGVHYPSDVFAGVTISGFACTIVLRFGRAPVTYILEQIHRITGGVLIATQEQINT